MQKVIATERRNMVKVYCAALCLFVCIVYDAIIASLGSFQKEESFH
jgi:hypothetical protein